jgi:hypothetical protein
VARRIILAQSGDDLIELVALRSGFGSLQARFFTNPQVIWRPADVSEGFAIHRFAPEFGCIPMTARPAPFAWPQQLCALRCYDAIGLWCRAVDLGLRYPNKLPSSKKLLIVSRDTPRLAVFAQAADLARTWATPNRAYVGFGSRAEELSTSITSPLNSQRADIRRGVVFRRLGPEADSRVNSDPNDNHSLLGH